MSASATTDDRFKLNRSATTAARNVLLGLLVIGLVGSLYDWSNNPRHFAFAWLFGFMAFLTLGLGSLGFVLIQHITGAFWSVTSRRVAEAFAACLGVFAILFIPIAMNLDHLYADWREAEHHAHGGEHASGESLISASTAQAQDGHEGHGHAPGAHPGAGHARPGHDAAAADEHGGHTPYETALHHSTLAKKVGYLNTKFWGARAVFYFAIWILVGVGYFRLSTRQDKTGDPALTRRMRSFAPAAIAGFALALTFAAFDWVMALEPTWYSTIFGVYVFAGSFMAAHALIIVVTLYLKSQGLLGDAVNVEHYHDLGKMMFGFVVFHAYIGYSQLMLQWYASIPEEVAYYHHRWVDGWRGITITLVLAHFVLPFIFVISRNVKRRLPMLGIAAAWLLVVHVLDMYWFVMPYLEVDQFVGQGLDIAPLFVIGSVYLLTVLAVMSRHSLVPTGDPQLGRSLGHVNH